RVNVQRFCETDEDYLAGSPKIGLAVTAGEIDAKAYYELINGGGKPECDDRRSAIEIQTTASIDLRGQLAAIAMPTSFLEDDRLIKTLLEEWHGFPLTYNADVGMRPTEFHGAIREMLSRHYTDLGLL